MPYSINQDAITWKGQEEKETRKQSSELPYIRYSKAKKYKSVDKIENIGKYKQHNQGKCRKIQKNCLGTHNIPIEYKYCDGDSIHKACTFLSDCLHKRLYIVFL